MEQSAQPPGIPNTKKWKISMFILFALQGISFASWTSRTPELRDILQASTSVMGWIIFGIALGSIIGLSSASSAISRFGAKNTIWISVIIVVCGLSLSALSALWAAKVLVFSGLVLFGIGYGAVDVAMNVEGTFLERISGKTFLPALHASFSGGTLIGVGLGSVAISLHIPIHVHIWAICVILFVTLIAIISNLPQATGKKVKQTAKDSEQPGFNPLKESRLWSIGIIVMGMALAEGTANDWLPIIFVDSYQVTHFTGSLFYGIFLFAMLLGRISGGRFLDRFGRVPVLSASAVLALIGLSLVIFTSDLYAAGLGVFFWGCGAALGFPVGLSAAGDHPQGATERVAIVSTVGYLAFLVGPPMIGILGDSFGLLKSLIIVMVAVFISGLLSPAASSRR